MASIDNKVVSISFDNAGFEKNVAQTMKTLAALKASLDFKGASAGLEDISAASSKFSLAGIGSAVEDISAKFSAMGAVAFSIINNITTRAMDAGLSLAKSFTIQPMVDGFAEFELKMGSIQTIMSGSGEPLEVVNQKLQELNTYSDKTIYSFKDMTSNIGKFTNAGLSLDQSVASIQGIANVAAISGANSEEASRAMYNFAQSLSSGAVKLMDWKSIENANMATAGFKTELLESAVAAGTLTKDAEGLYQTLEGTPVTATKGFNESLTEQWLTTEALNATLARYSDETTEIGKKATAAATDVKTFSQMMDTLKEAAGSGWAQTSELIFGDFEEGKKLWTGINDSVGGMIGASAEARNAVVQIWKDGGGRTLMIKSLGEAISNLGDIIRPIKEAFREVFPATTGRDLLTMTVRFSEFVKKLKPTEKVIGQLKQTFLGVFSAIRIVIEVVKGVVSVFTGLFSIFSGGAGGGILLFFSKIGSGVNELRKALVDDGGIAKFFDKITESLAALISKVNLGPTIKSIKEFISGLDFGPAVKKVTEIKDVLVEFFKGLDFSGPIDALNTFKEAIFGFFDKDISMPKQVGQSFSALGEVFKSIGRFIQSALNGIGVFGKAVGKAGAAIGGFLGDVQNELANLWGLLKDSFSTGNFDMVLKGVQTGLFGGLLLLIRKFMKNGFKLDLGQFGVMDELQKSLSAVTGGLKAMQNNIRADTLMKIAIALGVLTLSMLALSLVDAEDLTKAVVAMTAGFIQLTAVMVALEKVSSGPMAAAKLILLAAGLTILAGAMFLLGLSAKLMSTMSWGEMAKGLAGVGAMLIFLTAAVKPLSANSGGMIRAGIGIMAISAALLLLGLSVKLMSMMSWEDMAQGLVGVSVSLLVLTTAMSKMDGKGVIKSAISIGILGLSLVVLAGAIKVMASLGLAETAQGLIGIGAGLAILVAVFNKIDNKKIGATGAAILLVSIGMMFMAKAVSQMSALSWSEMVKGLAGFAVVLIMLALAMKATKASLGGAVALFLIASALDKLTGTLENVGRLPWKVIVQGLVVMGAAIAGLAITTNILTPLIPLMAGFGAALFLVGAGAALFGAGVYLIARAVQILATAGKAGVDVFISVLDDLLLKLPAVAIAFGEAAFLFVTSFLSGFSELIPMVVGLIGQLLEAIVVLVPQFIETAVVIITSFLEGMRTVFPELVQTGIDMLLAYLTAVRDNIGEVVTLAIEIMTEFILAIAGQVDNLAAAAVTLIVAWIGAIGGMINDIIAAGVKLVVDFIKGITKNMSKVTTAATDLVVEFVASLGRNYLKVVGAGTDLIIDLIKGFEKAASRIVTAGVDAILAFLEGVGKNAVKLARGAADVIITFVNGIATAINDKAPELREAGGRLGMAVADGMTFGLASKAGNVIKKVGDIAGGAINGAKKLFGINSPSKVFMAIGAGVVEGLSMGLDKDGRAQKSVSNLANGVVDTFKDSLNGLPKIIAGLDDFNPTIKPVLDLSGVHQDAKALNGIFANKSVAAAYNQASLIAATTSAANGDTKAVDTGPTEIKFEQNNYSPKALTTNDIYRGTRSQIALAKEKLGIPS